MAREIKDYRCRDPKCKGVWRSKLQKGQPTRTMCPVCRTDLITGAIVRLPPASPE